MNDEALNYIDNLIMKKLMVINDDEMYCIHANTKDIREKFSNLSKRQRSMLLSYYFNKHSEYLVCVTVSKKHRFYIARKPRNEIINMGNFGSAHRIAKIDS